jgi:two-component system response regulator RegA
MSDPRQSVLLVDDDDFLRDRMARALDKRGYQVSTAANVDDALAVAEAEQPDMAVIDLKMPGRSGQELLAELRRVSPDTRSVILTGYGSIANAVDAMRLGAVNYLTKPADVDQVVEAFRRVETAPEPAPDPSTLHAPSLAEAEWNHIQQVLTDCDGNVTRAAEKLDIPRRTLQRKLKKLAP